MDLKVGANCTYQNKQAKGLGQEISGSVCLREGVVGFIGGFLTVKRMMWKWK